MKIAIEVKVQASRESVWQAWTTPSAIKQWNFASNDWCCPAAELDLQEGGHFKYRMQEADGELGFDFTGTFTQIQPQQLIEFELGDGRSVSVEFTSNDQGTLVREVFEAEDEDSAEQQRLGWLSILQNFKSFVENNNSA